MQEVADHHQHQLDELVRLNNYCCSDHLECPVPPEWGTEGVMLRRTVVVQLQDLIRRAEAPLEKLSSSVENDLYHQSNGHKDFYEQSATNLIASWGGSTDFRGWSMSSGGSTANSTDGGAGDGFDSAGNSDGSSVDSYEFHLYPTSTETDDLHTPAEWNNPNLRRGIVIQIKHCFLGLNYKEGDPRAMERYCFERTATRDKRVHREAYLNMVTTLMMHYKDADLDDEVRFVQGNYLGMSRRQLPKFLPSKRNHLKSPFEESDFQKELGDFVTEMAIQRIRAKGSNNKNGSRGGGGGGKRITTTTTMTTISDQKKATTTPTPTASMMMMSSSFVSTSNAAAAINNNFVINRSFNTSSMMMMNNHIGVGGMKQPTIITANTNCVYHHQHHQHFVNNDSISTGGGGPVDLSTTAKVAPVVTPVTMGECCASTNAAPAPAATTITIDEISPRRNPPRSCRLAAKIMSPEMALTITSTTVSTSREQQTRTKAKRSNTTTNKKGSNNNNNKKRKSPMLQPQQQQQSSPPPLPPVQQQQQLQQYQQSSHLQEMILSSRQQQQSIATTMPLSINQYVDDARAMQQLQQQQQQRTMVPYYSNENVRQYFC